MIKLLISFFKHSNSSSESFLSTSSLSSYYFFLNSLSIHFCLSSSSAIFNFISCSSYYSFNISSCSANFSYLHSCSNATIVKLLRFPILGTAISSSFFLHSSSSSSSYLSLSTSINLRWINGSSSLDFWNSLWHLFLKNNISLTQSAFSSSALVNLPDFPQTIYDFLVETSVI